MDIAKEAHKILKKNRQITAGHQYTLPSLRSYPYQWLWDSCFHAIALSSLEPEAAKEELRSLVSKQFEEGMIPHMIYWQTGDLHRYDWGKDGTSALTQPPMIAYVVEQIYNLDKDKAFLREIYPSLWRFYKYLIEERDPRNNHLIGIINPDESGEDNSPRFDAVLGVDSHVSFDEHLKRRAILIKENTKCNFDAGRCMKNYFWVKDVPFNSILIANLESLARLAHELDIKQDAEFCKTNAESIRGAMRKFMYENGVFWSTYGNDYKKIKVATWAHFAPLFVNLYSPEEARALIDNHLLNTSTFRSPYGIRTVSKEEPSYDPAGFWRGPVWMSVHWFIFQGLKKYGFEKESKMILEMSIALLEREGFREYYNSETGEGLGAEDFTWGALVVDMMRQT